MDEILKIQDLCKNYPKFSLKNVSFTINAGEIMGFIGRNGAGKTTTLKSIMNLLHYDSGCIMAFGKDMSADELENKQRIGFALSELNYYPNRTIKQMVNVIKRFYKDFDMDKFNKLAELFNLDMTKKLEALSSGMKVKFSLATALSHNAELLILDEPTSGLDPISRDEILDIFRQIVREGNRAILFSTHITSDLDKCATNITYIHDGEIKFTGKKVDLINSYLFVSKQEVPESALSHFIGYKEIDGKIEGLIKSEDKKYLDICGVEAREPDLEEIMVYLERSERTNESFII
ncbi:MAG: ABC transporter ATP-binding protein [Bacilli bacterium]|nr:ABC transporter ATP-binding protein [Bacilli bacterium]